MDAITMIVTALSAGAGSAIEDGAASALKEAYATLMKQARQRLTGQRNGETVLTEYEEDPETWKSPLVKALQDADADNDAELIGAAEALLRLTDPSGFGQGKYVIQAWGNEGIQIGDGNTQHNTFEPPR